ncbi:MAG: methylated-DNA--[protein]-cysteine S-methyltransferase [Bacteroidia bacterium]|nr:methylated-DNA--[protein]-cysteine S-methyltransferase [Bacteroidia bacterium]
MPAETIYYKSPIGLLEISADKDSITSLYFVDEKTQPISKSNELLKESVIQLEEYFNGIRKEFGLKLNPHGTDFQKKVWNELEKIPFGKTFSYLDISIKLGDANATRAVGNANGSNPISIIIPCHRVIGVNGKLVGYGGGLWRKEWLLNHEKNITFGQQTELF